MERTLWHLGQECEKFQENGLWGLRSPGGSVLFSAEYDEIHEWEHYCDVVCVRKGCDVCYYNHKKDEILTGLKPLLENKCLIAPDVIANTQVDKMMVCLEPIKEKTTDMDCFAYGRWVRLSILPRAQVRDLFTGCALRSVDEHAIRHFEHRDTYEFSARVCTSKGACPISSCIEKFKQLWVYNCSWEYFFKISINSKTKLSTHDLYKAIKHFEDLDDEVISINYAVDFDDSLEVSAVRVLQVNYYWEWRPNRRYEYVLSEGTIDDVKAELSHVDIVDREEAVTRGFYYIDYSEERCWEDTEKVLEFLKMEGSDIAGVLDKQLDFNYFWMEKITPDAWTFKRKMVDWALRNGAQINRISHSMTYLEYVRKCLSRCDDQNCDTDEAKESRLNGKRFAKWLKSKGAVSAKVQRRGVEARLEGMSPMVVFDAVKTVL